MPVGRRRQGKLIGAITEQSAGRLCKSVTIFYQGQWYACDTADSEGEACPRAGLWSKAGLHAASGRPTPTLAPSAPSYSQSVGRQTTGKPSPPSQPRIS